MLKDELIKMLQEIPGNPEVCILDGFNGGGEPRTINLTPHLVLPEYINSYDRSDCDTDSGDLIIMGYGCY